MPNEETAQKIEQLAKTEITQRAAALAQLTGCHPEDAAFALQECEGDVAKAEQLIRNAMKRTDRVALRKAQRTTLVFRGPEPENFLELLPDGMARFGEAWSEPQAVAACLPQILILGGPQRAPITLGWGPNLPTIGQLRVTLKADGSCESNCPEERVVSFFRALAAAWSAAPGMLVRAEQ